MAAKRKLTKQQKALFDLLTKRTGAEIEQDDILRATGWKPSVWRVCRTNRLYAAFLRETKSGTFLVTLRPPISEEEFRRQVSQSKRSDHFETPLAQALSRRSAENFVLAVEVYNRPSLSNRLDAFALLFTTAWEQVLKAELVEMRGEDAIFRPVKQGRRRESISLSECLDALLPDTRDPVRLNLERIAELRHAAAHLVMPELQPVYSGLFQAGVLNFARWYRERTGLNVVPRHNVGMLALATDAESLDSAPLARAYGDLIAADIVAQAKTIGDQIESVNDERFAIRVEYTLRLAKKNENPDITLAHAADAPLSAVVFTKAIDSELKYPLRTEQLRRAVHEKLGKPFSSHDLQSILFKEGWKNGDNEFHKLQRNPDTPKFSHEAVEAILTKLHAPEYLERARKSYSHHLRKLQRKGTSGA